MNRFPNILGEILNIEEEDNDDLDVLYAVTRRSEGFSQGRLRRHRGSVPGHRTINRDRVEGHERLYHDYFATPCVYESFFRRGFRMRLNNMIHTSFKEQMPLEFSVCHPFKR